MGKTMPDLRNLDDVQGEEVRMRELDHKQVLLFSSEQHPDGRSFPHVQPVRMKRI